MNSISEIEKILAAWNPIEVPANIAHSEYRGYAPELAALKGDELATIAALEVILTDTMGLSYDSDNPEQKNEVVTVAKKICCTHPG
ncbi:MAG: hypothetical protein H6990_05670 [Pseudomonadales bacterium]|nr:hypothetical protein [Pseudomonadales bacterium]MCP5204328.1 hypothetical protein [Pseudomonadales bacterium]